MKHERALDLKEIIDLVGFIMRRYIRYPQGLEVDGSMPHPGNFFISVRGHVADQSKLIGAKARNIKAVQTVMQEIGNRHNCSIHVTVLETTKGQDEPRVDYLPDFSWDKSKDEELVTLLSMIVSKFRILSSVTASPSGDRTALSIDSSEVMSPLVEAALNTIFRAIGRTMGRMVSVHACSYSANKSDAAVAGSRHSAGPAN